jgi:lipoprotein signal peptidase
MPAWAKRIVAVVGALALLALDRYAKWYATAALPPAGVTVLPGVRFFFFNNPGLAFSLSVSGVARTVSLLAFILLAIVALVSLIRDARHLSKPRTLLAVALIAFGGGSNIFDRLTTTGVTDYLLFFNRSAVNLADGMILAGILLLIFKKK